MSSNTLLNKIFNIKGKTVLITGASGYLGRHMVEGFLQVGATVISLEGCSDVNFYDRGSLDKRIRQIVADDEIDVVINNAYDMGKETGFNTPRGKLENTPHKMWKDTFDSSLYPVVLITQIVGDQMKKRGGGSIINIASMYGVVAPNPRLYEGTEFFNPPTYSAAKAAILAFTRYTASFWGRNGIRCNAVSPGPFPNLGGRTENSVNNSEFMEKLARRTLLNRVGIPEELMGTLILLASDASSYITGQNIIVDGGWTVT